MSAPRVPGSLMVKPRWLGLRRGFWGGGGMMKAGEDGADIDLADDCLDLSPSSGTTTTPVASWGMAGEGGTLSDRFLVFRGFLLGDWGRPLPGPGLGGGGTIERSFATRPRDRNEGRAIKESGESGEEPGVACSSDGMDSTVEMVVVGDELLEEDVDDVETLLWDLCTEWCSDVITGGGANCWAASRGGGGAKRLDSTTGEQPDISVSRIEATAAATAEPDESPPLAGPD